ncbi:Carbonate dehydratase [Paenibacillus curdlanolyticus YK9]|uniref:Carbonate dehydratase n=1 Tax=Paenibacillus curdlanolyticus YK9 TaxID=717606 RepID=E0ICY7_9BACL|nr:carbonate dehydratase [Paenibacillus curdlanolyticus]EFM09442.1 Carbonate dehydratase [Paenibacillus curdlanolyticus YK9]
MKADSKEGAGESSKLRALTHFLKPEGPFNMFIRFISPNPRTPTVPQSKAPAISGSAFISPFVSIIGDVTVRDNVFIAPCVSIRADEGSPFYIGDGSNIQDGVVLHGLKDEQVTVNGRSYSIYIGNGVTCAHGALVHGPCAIGDNVFVGFQALVFDAEVGSGAFVSNQAVVTSGVRIRENRFVPPGAMIDTQAKADRLNEVPTDQKQFVKGVQRVNQAFPASYNMLFGSKRCSCGLAKNH